ncbi:hypothetical protein RJT34_25567 [Clitoria ternatea]|uniref:Uncharacterized protein n=1 Tax=Clitoria ternatea TaxID=43366 RepID=A0AAN9FY26_CLITE
MCIFFVYYLFLAHVLIRFFIPNEASVKATQVEARGIAFAANNWQLQLEIQNLKHVELQPAIALQTCKEY